MNIRIFLLLALSFSYFISAEQISVMSYNLNNLFDAQDDVGKDDKAYLPIALKTMMIILWDAFKLITLSGEMNAYSWIGVRR